MTKREAKRLAYETAAQLIRGKMDAWQDWEGTGRTPEEADKIEAAMKEIAESLWRRADRLASRRAEERG